ncbi:heparinase II/III family protein [Gelidibacter maritimus]|uniref:Heparinase II/III family protein n=1 Tax=Gelidibacter maritimus TaxID=2761487 RepID=A0A7W2M502_9FLAO|nr:heparinase II/III family protein [Gelidibacter maritimus]MBA6152829.1 heparinase II/III family protein [Gelidibacter maritimus]
MMNPSSTYLIFFFSIYSFVLFGQTIPSDKIIPIIELRRYLKEDLKTKFNGSNTDELASYFREKFSERYFFDWKQMDARFETYNDLYPNVKVSHQERALDHRSKFSAKTTWKLPFNYTDGSPVNAYAIRHLARQHKMVDIAFDYYYENKEPKFINYFKEQQLSLNAALLTNQFETIEDGNGVYEVFRSGYRILNWLQIHNMFLGEKNYSDDDQLYTIATLLQHGSDLFENNEEFTSGNHQTRGMSALAMLSILFQDFEDADLWFERSMSLLKMHLEKEINDDGFQFERTVHYHISDIDNYYYVYQLAKNSGMPLDPFWDSKLESLFTTLIKIAYPDKSAPVLSDDTDAPWAEKNDISGALTLGYVLFGNPEMGYFAKKKVESKMFWYLNNSQLELLKDITSKKPNYESLAFEDTGLYIMREGWEKNDRMLIISAGLDPKKPDHQHGDMLGIQAMANTHVLLPNYQVRYSLEDLELFKNSMVKNVALVDDELQGKEYASNKGGSGFGKFGKLPNPKTLLWKTNADLDVYIGSHDGFNNIGVDYSRQVIDTKSGFWIVKDNFKSNQKHTYKQVWQGHYSFENAPNLLRATFDDGSGVDILQLHDVDEVLTDGARGKEWSVLSKNDQNNFGFLTVIYPFSKYDHRIDENSNDYIVNGWTINKSNEITNSSSATIISKHEQLYAFSSSEITFGTVTITFESEVDVFITFNERQIHILSLSDHNIAINAINGKSIQKKLLPGETYTYTIQN